MKNCSDVLVMGAGPAALCIASELIQQGLHISALASHPPKKPWPNTYGIWAEELESLGMASLLGHRWQNTVSYFGKDVDKNEPNPVLHEYDYGLFDQASFQNALLEKCAGLDWAIETAEDIRFVDQITEVICSSGNTYRARIVIDASGHRSPFVKRPNQGPVAKQSAYGVVGKFNSPPVDKDQFVLMDFRSDHLTEKELKDPPSFLYAMDFGEDLYFVEETSLAYSPPVSWSTLKKRMLARLAHRDIQITKVVHEEYCLFPMNLPLPDRNQSLLAFGGSASMVHPASGYMVGALLRRAPDLAKELSESLSIEPPLNSEALSKKGWNVLWTKELIQRHRLYQFGLKRLMSFDEALLRSFFSTFFRLPKKDWSRFLANTLPLPELILVMLKLFTISPLKVKLGMIGVVIT
ncbi:Lycopene beta cyclase [Prochlorococcus marinus str. SS51]|uniref:lycopene beta cyclase n=1 Tax=Prochlorococcus sp. SS52 TaxID=1499501 RepID=UPI0005339334|nr:Lycopene beta cyclase [Prochlorococcus marinus str. SS2]KGG23348.1 Lycopene beta cyclase [Prochlorococcus marinus str. SS35]KGG32416.1 Lycopene beta cyclase [Prochlorococcus marinus str. SS51]